VAGKERRLHAREVLAAEGFDPALCLSRIASSALTPIALKIMAAKELLKYVYPALAEFDLSITHEGLPEDRSVVNIALANIMVQPELRKVLEQSILDASKIHSDRRLLEHGTSAVDIIDEAA
jgi:hypothetical protein